MRKMHSLASSSSPSSLSSFFAAASASLSMPLVSPSSNTTSGLPFHSKATTAHETPHEYSQDVFFGICFLVIALLSSTRLQRYFDPSGGGRVITLFYFLMFISSSSRALWFLIPSTMLEESYAPHMALIAWKSKGWVGVLISEILEATGSWSLYGSFILVTCYWSHMMKKVEMEALEPHGVVRPKPRGLGAISTFQFILSILISIEIFIIMAFLTRCINSEEMILFDSILLSIVAVLTSINMTILGGKIRTVLVSLGASTSTRPQVNRILAMTRLGNSFFTIRVAAECTFALSCMALMHRRHSLSVMLSDSYWDWYIAVKHFSEIIVLCSQLVISTAIKNYEAPRSMASTSSFTRSGRRGVLPVATTNSVPIQNMTGTKLKGVGGNGHGAGGGHDNGGATEVTPMLVRGAGGYQAQPPRQGSGIGKVQLTYGSSINI